MRGRPGSPLPALDQHALPTQLPLLTSADITVTLSAPRARLVLHALNRLRLDSLRGVLDRTVERLDHEALEAELHAVADLIMTGAERDMAGRSLITDERWGVVMPV